MNKPSLYSTTFLFCFRVTAILCLSAISLFAQSKYSVRVADEKTIAGERVTLSGIAEISGADDNGVKRLKSVSLGYAPNVGMTREISRGQITLAIAAAGFADNTFVLNAPEKVLIRREGQTVSPAAIGEIIEKSVTEKFSGTNISAQIARLELPQMMLIPSGTVEIRPNFSAAQNLFQPFSLPLEIRVDGKVFRRFSVNIEIEAFADVLIAAKDLTANMKLSESDARLEKRRITKPIAEYLRETANLRGLTLIKNIANGSEITSDSFVAGVVVKTGDPVRVEARSGKLKIVISGEARASGRIGDRIAVKNLQSGSILQAVVVDEGLVKISF